MVPKRPHWSCQTAAVALIIVGLIEVIEAFHGDLGT
jgi:hypothetical protein